MLVRRRSIRIDALPQVFLPEAIFDSVAQTLLAGHTYVWLLLSRSLFLMLFLMLSMLVRRC